MGVLGTLLARAHRHGGHHGHGSHHGHGDADAVGVIHAAGFYDRMTAVLFLGRRTGVYRRLAESSGLRPGDTVVDIGCGTGSLTRAVADAVGSSGSALGIDPSPEMVSFCREHVAGPARFEVAAAEDLDLPDATVDAVVSMLAYHHIDAAARPRALAQMLRVLRPGGRLMIADMSPDAAWASRLVGALTGPQMQHSRIAVIAEEVRGAGFTDVRTGRRGPFLGQVTARRPD